MSTVGSAFDRRRFLKSGAGAAGLACVPRFARAQGTKLRIGMMLPYSGAAAAAGLSVEYGFRLAVKEAGGRFGGRVVEIVKVNDESDPAKAAERVTQLLTHDKVDLLLGSAHPGVAAEMSRASAAAGVIHLVPAGEAGPVAPGYCTRGNFRSAHSYWQSGFGMGLVLSRRSAVKRVATLGWKQPAGETSVRGFRSGYLKGGGRIVKEFWLPYPDNGFQTLLAAITVLKPDALYASLADAAAAKFLREYNQSGLMPMVPLFGPGFLTEGVLAAVGGAAEGVETVLHYGDGLETPKNKAFRLAYGKAYRRKPDLQSVSGYDAGLLLDAGMKAVSGDLGSREKMIHAMEQATVDSPRGAMRLSMIHTPIHDQYLRKVIGNENRVMEIAVKALSDDPAMKAACRGA